MLQRDVEESAPVGYRPGLDLLRRKPCRPMTAETSSAYLRRLGTWDAAAIVIGGVIGAGIFRSASTVAERTSSGAQLLTLWAIGGLLTLAGVLCYAELGARRPQAGGVYIYLREAYGQLPAFLFGWTMALINYPGSVAAVATTFADYTCAAVGLSPQMWVKPVAAGAIAFIVGVNFFGIRAGSRMLNVFTLLKLSAIALVVVTGVILAHGQFGNVLATDTTKSLPPGALLGALLPVLFTYGGFHYLNDLAGEVREPQRTLPRALGLGLGGVVVCYVLVNFAYLAGLGHAGLAASQAPAADLMRHLFGESGATLIAVGIACSTFGYCSIAIAGGARVLQTMGADGMLFGPVGRIHARSHAPRVALAVLGGWAIVLVISGSFGQLVDYTTVGEWLSHAFGISTLFWYRRRFRDEPSPYRVPLYPVLPLLFVLTVLGVIVATAIHSPGDAGMSLVLILVGVPVYYAWRAWQRRAM
jgi:APA family basic amino acid/polyamine antiporter